MCKSGKFPKNSGSDLLYNCKQNPEEVPEEFGKKNLKGLTGLITRNVYKNAKRGTRGRIPGKSVRKLWKNTVKNSLEYIARQEIQEQFR